MQLHLLLQIANADSRSSASKKCTERNMSLVRGIVPDGFVGGQTTSKFPAKHHSGNTTLSHRLALSQPQSTTTPVSKVPS